jgi:hypothetical protein
MELIYIFIENIWITTNFQRFELYLNLIQIKPGEKRKIPLFTWPVFQPNPSNWAGIPWACSPPVKQGGAHDGSTLAAGRFPGVPVMRWGGAVPRGTTTVRRTDLGGWGKGKLTRGRPSTAVKSGGGESMLAGRSGGQWRRWSGRRAPGHRVEARGHVGGTRQWPEQAVRMEDTGGGGIEGNRHQRRYTVAIGVGGWVGVVTGGRADLRWYRPAGSGSELAGRRHCTRRTWRWLFLAPLLYKALKPARMGGGGVHGHGAMQDKNAVCTWSSSWRAIGWQRQREVVCGDRATTACLCAYMRIGRDMRPWAVVGRWHAGPT